MSNCRVAAIQYATAGWCPVPAHVATANGCSCGDNVCTKPGKHPCIPWKGITAPATSKQIETWWARRSTANVALVTGPSRLAVIDIDAKNGGLGEWRKLVEIRGDPGGLIADSGGGGEHRYYLRPADVQIPSRTNVLGQGIDVRAEGGLIIAPPSKHQSGRCYKWRAGCGPEDRDLPPPSPWLLELIVKPQHEHQQRYVSDRSLDEEAELLRVALQHIDADDYEIWTNVGLALKDSALPRARALFDEWSSASTKYNAAEVERKWTRDLRPDGRISVGSVFHWAEAAGWVPPWRGNGARASPRVTIRGPAWKPFPVDALPQPIASYVHAVSACMGVDATYSALPVLSVLSASIGNARAIRLKGGWVEPCLIWSAIVGESGTGKSPPLAAATQPLRALQADEFRRHGERVREHQRAVLEHDRALTSWRKSKTHQEPPERPEEPLCTRAIVSDVTIESLAGVLVANPRGVLLSRDELRAWLASFDRYRAKSGRSDSAQWLEIHGARDLIVDRKTGMPRTIHVPRANVSVCGSIQPEVLWRALGIDGFQEGLASRLLLGMPPRKAKHWSDAELRECDIEPYSRLIADLRGLDMGQDANGILAPIVLGLTPEAKELWISYYNRHALRQAEAIGDLAAAWSKIEGYAARIALIVHCVRAVTAECPPDAVDADSLSRGVTMADWFADEAERVYHMLGSNEEQRELERLVEAVRLRGGEVTVRDWQKSRGLASAEIAGADLGRLVQATIADWVHIQPTPGGGRPSRAVRLRMEPTPGQNRQNRATDSDQEEVSSVLSGVRCVGEPPAADRGPVPAPTVEDAPPSLPAAEEEEPAAQLVELVREVADVDPAAADRISRYLEDLLDRVPEQGRAELRRCWDDVVLGTIPAVPAGGAL